MRRAQTIQCRQLPPQLLSIRYRFSLKIHGAVLQFLLMIVWALVAIAHTLGLRAYDDATAYKYYVFLGAPEYCRTCLSIERSE